VEACAGRNVLLYSRWDGVFVPCLSVANSDKSISSCLQYSQASTRYRSPSCGLYSSRKGAACAIRVQASGRYSCCVQRWICFRIERHAFIETNKCKRTCYENKIFKYLIFVNMLITVAARSKAWTVFARSNTGVMGSNPTRNMDVCVRLFYVCVVLCVGSGFATGWSPVQRVLPFVYRIKKVKKRTRPTRAVQS
jgi:hypothetical protein